MANIQIPNLGPAIALNGQEQLEIVQAGVSCRTTTQAVADLALPYISTLQTSLQNVPCASYYSTQTQNHGVAGNVAIVTCNQTDFEYGVSKVSNTRFTAPINGIYNFQFSLQLVSSLNNKHAYVWLKKNGSNVASSNTEVDLANKDYGYVAAWNFMVNLNAGNYLELAWTSDDTVTLKASSPAPYGPDVPSAIVTMNLIRRT